ncbi:hypothetical protein BAUCODRAFT_542051 [Baudoinia panamericana UAMH 10762]|uniref:F-box domain-containing protein n=1 Tax=Baudoinia panamericana (strain UAMH 10762) TaxID=717646 RepID=M2MFM8_BAUPA|nr:uncharacterized protein BAUCODRAFT_542051 [Baudoinia panamericana UAMH 10762]EMC95451.1 hypothetical protein BAUCODRAFT_542051 [Baudoinia panamericana UAMH 10762]
MENFHDDLVIELATHLDIDSFMNFRLVNKHIWKAVQSRIAAVTLYIAKRTFPGQKRILLRMPTEEADARWLASFRSKQLAMITVECLKPSIPADDPLCDSVWHKVEASWDAVASRYT